MAKNESSSISAETQPTGNRLIKNNLFVTLFQEKKDLLDLYNGVNGTSYTDPEELQINTLENAVLMKMHNDLSFVFRFELSLYEHQSTVNQNLPVRDLFYVTSILKGLIPEDKLYHERLIKIPFPRFVVFYNGKDYLPEKSVLKLSDAYEIPSESPELELKVTIYNANYGYNEKLMEKCHRLHDYAWFIAKIRKYLEMGIDKDEAINKAIDDAIKHGILADYLKKHRAEVLDMVSLEYNEEMHIKAIRDEAHEEDAERLAEKDAQLAEKDEQLAEKDEQLAELKAKLARYEQNT